MPSERQEEPEKEGVQRVVTRRQLRQYRWREHASLSPRDYWGPRYEVWLDSGLQAILVRYALARKEKRDGSPRWSPEGTLLRWFQQAEEAVDELVKLAKEDRRAWLAQFQK